ncbi:hypothetical protein SUGI_0294640 [Cryptomeria japonica]|uniref:kinesin-like protein KIN-12G n=1 Tax=Cryptomeria japonica TaxID=3369 RepID=UPI002408E7EF|nr:kinesin-like protein KIN-12G [Cryptomeria japonica]XP_057861761.2 kinesin-like protein KIN-12G [Cryptomeria japonica]GLJ17029.1 hypothetical protein SUGI_0294640 [Cryptomeria japonica]
MKKTAASPLRIPVKNSPRKMFSDMITNNGDANHSLEINARDYSFPTMRPPLCPIPEGSLNLPGGTNAEHDLITPRPKLDSTTHFALMKLSGPGSAHGFSQSGDNMFRGSNCSTPDSELLNSSTGFSYTKNRFGWQEPRSHSLSATEMDFAKHSTGLTKYPSQGSLHEMGFLCEPVVFSMVSSSDNASATSNGVARSLKYNQSVTASTGSLPALPPAESQIVAPLKSLQLESKNNFVQHHFELQEDPSFWDDHNVQVVIRIRPLSGIEVASQGHSRCLRQDSSHTLTWLGNPESRFTFDLVAGEKITQDKLFRVAGLPMVENCMRGYNSCMFAYGQTGSGKTHTMLGDIEDAEQKLSANRGMTPRVFEHLFTRIHREEDTRREENLKFVCKCSFLEIYNEQVADLLEPSSTNLQMREDAKKGVYVENLSEIEVKGVNDVIKLLLQGAANRKVAATNMNRASSRSHSVFTCIIESKWECQSVTHHRFGRLNLVDLAGSERQKSSGAEGERLKEATNINKSLSTLGLVIMNLVNIANGKTQHVPYRDSKLTFLLQDSLGGNSKTIIIANVSPANCCGMETLSTLKFAQRAKFIRNNATVNENATGDVITLKMEIQQLKEEVSRLRGKLKGEVEHLQEEDYGNMNLLSSPGAYACDSRGVASPSLGYKKAPRKRDLESALVGALKRERAMEMQMKAMTAEIEQLKYFVKQREEDAQCGKMMLRFREDRIKRLEAVASDKMSAEAHLLEEKTVLMEELQILRNRLDRNPEVTRFAMENIRLMEQLRRFQELYEGGQHEQMVEQIAVLRDQLLEALDWKLMHELDPNLANQKELSETEFFSEECEILQKQVDQHRREADALRNNLSFCLEAKEKLERRVDDLMFQIEKMKVSNNTGMEEMATATEVNYSQEVEADVEGLSAQRELKDLVEAISVASQREAEAQGDAIFLATEVEDLRKKLRESVDDNKRLIDMFEKVIQERDEIRKAEEDSREVQEKLQEQVLLLRNQVEELQKEIDGQSDTFRKDDYTNNWPEGVNVVNAEVEQTVVLRKEVDDLRLKLHDTSEENERLLELYEKAMQEKDEIRKAEKDSREVQIKLQEQVLLLRNQVEKLEEEIDGQNSTVKDNCADNVVSAEAEQTISLRKEVGDLQLKLHDTSEENDRLLELYEKAMQDRHDIRKMWWDSVENVTDIQAGAYEGPRSPETLIVGNDKEKIQEYRSDKAEKEVVHLRNEVEEIQMKFKDVLEENERLIDMYEKAMQEKDEIRKLWNENVKNNFSSKFMANVKNGIESQDLINEVEKQQTESQENDKAYGFQEEPIENEIEYQKLTRKSDETEKESKGQRRSGAFISSLSPQNEEKLKVLQEQEQQVQNKFKEMDVKLEFFGESMDNLNMIKEKLEGDLELVCDQAAELVSSIAEKETRLQAMQLEHGQLVRRLQESEQHREELAHLSKVEKGKWVEKEAEVHGVKDPMIESMTNREKILLQELTLARSKLVIVQKRVEEATQLVDGLSILEKSYNEMEDNRKISEVLKKEFTYKKEQIDALQACSNEMQAKRVRIFNKLSALQSLMSDLSASEEYWKSQESRANEKVETFTCLMREKMEELTDLQTTKKALEAAIEQTIEMEATAQAKVCELKDKLKLAEQQRADAEKMVVQDKQAVLCSDLRSSAEHTPMQFVKAASLLKGEEERIKLLSSLKEFMEQVKEHRESIKKLEGKLDLVESSIQQVQSKVNAESAALKEAEVVLQRTLNEKKMIIDSQEEARLELDILILELQSSEFDVQSKEEELNDRREYLQNLYNRLCELQNKDKINQELEPEHYFITQQVLAKLQDIHGSVSEANASLDSLKLHELKRLDNIIGEK